MRKISFIWVAPLAAMFLIMGQTACSDWKDYEAKDFQPKKQTEEYYANLRAWKDTWKEREISFGWFGGWYANEAHMRSALCGVPDSMDLIAIWSGGDLATSPLMQADLKEVREVKGTKVVWTYLSGWVGAGIDPDRLDYEAREAKWGWEVAWNTVIDDVQNYPESEKYKWVATDPAERARQVEAIKKYARAMGEKVLADGYDGVDIDHEPNNGGTGSKREMSNKENFHVFVEELGKYIGPKSPNPDKMLIIDGEVSYIKGETAPYFDYFIKQDYYWASISTVQSNFTSLANVAKEYVEPADLAAKYLTTVDYEKYRSNGGGVLTDVPNMSRIEAYAHWNPKYNGQDLPRKGGVGGFHFEYEYTVPGKPGFYWSMRSAMNIMNPPGGEETEE